MAKKASKTKLADTSGTPKTQSPNVGFIRPEITALTPQYDLIRDCLAGELHMKKKRDKYLPIPNAADKSKDNEARYNAYIERAVFYGVSKRTLAGLVGQIFLRDPVVEVPSLLEPLKADMSGSGVTMDQFASMCSANALSYGRVGVFIDYPDTDTPATAAQIQAGKVRPAVLMFKAWQVINWRTIVIDGREVLSLVVIYESVVADDDGFETKTKEQWRVLSLRPQAVATVLQSDDLQAGIVTEPEGPLLYTVEVWERGSDGFSVSESYEPKDSSGARLTEIPFMFVGVHNNDANPDDPPLYDLASLNVAHYRNSADYEESVFIVGQPTPVFAGLTEDWVKNVMKGEVRLGARGAVLLPVNGSAELMQAQPNTLAKEAMDQKERQMVALGAKLVEQKSVQRTLGEAELENASESSVLSNVGKNVELAVKFALTWCATFLGADAASIDYQLNTEFDLTSMDPQARAALIADWQAGGITTSEYRANLRRAGIATLDDKTYSAERKKDETDGIGPQPKTPPAGAPGTKPVAENQPPA